MLKHRIVPGIGSTRFALVLLSSCLTVAASTLAHAANVGFTAQVDSSRINLDDSVTLTLTIRSEQASVSETPQFEAPDFQVVGEYSSLSVSSKYDSTLGGFSSERSQVLTKVLHPTKTGSLKISKIQLSANGTVFRAPDIVVTVLASGANTGAKPGSGGGAVRLPGFPHGMPGGMQQAMPGFGVQPHRPMPQKLRLEGTGAVIRVETDKSSYYKGEQAIVSYYLYHQMKLLNIQVDKFPVLNGFLREDLEIPVMGQRLVSEGANLNGVPYERALLARYAAYPLESGTLKLDSMALKFNYYPNSGGQDEDPFFGFFQQMVPKVWTGKSEQITVEVLPLPEDGKPKSFTGGIGDYSVVSAVDQTEVHANNAVTLTVKVEGQGNIATVQMPKAEWPPDVELFDSKGKVQAPSAGRKGVGIKVFEYLFIPRLPGPLTLPGLEFSFFDPVKKQYYTKTTEPVKIQVLGPAPGTVLTPVNRSSEVSKRSGSASHSSSAQDQELKDLKSFTQHTPAFSLSRLLYALCSLVFVGAVLLVAYDGLRARKLARKKEEEAKKAAHHGHGTKIRQRLHSMIEGATKGAPWSEVAQAYELLSEEVLEALEEKYDVSLRSVSRSQLEAVLVGEKGLPQEDWDRISQLLEYSETVRFAGSTGGTLEASARMDLAKWVDEGETLVAKDKG